MATPDSHHMKEDLSYIRAAVERMEEGQYRSITIAVLWAVIVTVGFAINDFRPQIAMVYWPVAAVSGYFISLFVGRRGTRADGECSPGDIGIHALHLGSLFVLNIAALVFALTHGLDGPAMGQLFTLLGGAGLFYGGLHLDRRFLVPGVILVIGAPAIDFIGPYPWTIVGAATGLSLVFSALRMKPVDGRD